MKSKKNASKIKLYEEIKHMRIKEKNTKVRLIVAIILAIVMTATIIVSKKYIASGADAPTTEAVLTRRRYRVVLTGQGRH